VAIGLATKFTNLQLEEGRYLVGAFAGFFVVFHLILTLYTFQVSNGSFII
jgi:hypothetical protein